LAQRVLQNAAVLEVLDLLLRIDADPSLELLLAPVGSRSRDLKRIQ